MSPEPHPHVEPPIRELVFHLFCKINCNDNGQSLLHSLDTLTHSLLAFHTAVQSAFIFSVLRINGLKLSQSQRQLSSAVR